MDEPLPPYTLGQVGGLSQGGITQKLLDAIFRRLDLKYEIQLVPFARAIKSAQAGKSDGLPLLMKNEERVQFLLFTDPILENKEVFYFSTEKTPHFQWTDYTDLKGLTIGLVNGYTYGEHFLAAIKQYDLEILYAKDTTENLRRLIAGRVDLTLEDESIVKTLLADFPEWKTRIQAADKLVTSYFWYMGVSKKSPLAERIEEINRILAAMRADGSLATILNDR